MPKINKFATRVFLDVIRTSIVIFIFYVLSRICIELLVNSDSTRLEKRLSLILPFFYVFAKLIFPRSKWESPNRKFENVYFDRQKFIGSIAASGFAGLTLSFVFLLGIMVSSNFFYESYFSMRDVVGVFFVIVAGCFITANQYIHEVQRELSGFDATTQDPDN